MGKEKLEINFGELNKILADGNKWILKSGIQINSIKNRGGYYAWINTRTKNYSYIFRNNRLLALRITVSYIHKLKIKQILKLLKKRQTG